MRARAALLLAPLLALPLLGAPASAQAAPEVEVVPLVFTVATGPDEARECTVLGDLYLPASTAPTA